MGAGGIVGGALTGAVGALGGGLANILGGAYAIQQGHKGARRQRQWAQWMYEHRHQLAVKDLRKAGLNPILAASGGAGAAPSGAAAGGFANPGAGAAASARQLGLLYEEHRRARAEAGAVASSVDKPAKTVADARAHAEIEEIMARATHASEQAKRASAEIKRVGAETKMFDVNARLAETEIHSAKALEELYKQHGWLKWIEGIGRAARGMGTRR